MAGVTGGGRGNPEPGAAVGSMTAPLAGVTGGGEGTTSRGRRWAGDGPLGGDGGGGGGNLEPSAAAGLVAPGLVAVVGAGGGLPAPESVAGRKRAGWRR